MCIRKHYGGGEWTIPRSVNNDLYIVWPTREGAILGVEGAVQVLYGREFRDILDETQRKEQVKRRVKEIGWTQLLREPREAGQTIIDPRDTRPFLIRALKWLKNKQQDLPARKHENIRT
ncbi:Propionyl-CoA carboxylase beta chain [subsurface metagenome]